MLKLNVNGQSYIVSDYSRTSDSKVNFGSSLIISHPPSSLQFLSDIINSKDTQKLSIHLGAEDACKYECEMVSFDPVYESPCELEQVRVLKGYDFRIGLSNHAFLCDNIDIELWSIKCGFYSGVLKGKVWFVFDSYEVQYLKSPCALNLNYYDYVSKTWPQLLNGWNLVVENEIKTHPINLNGKVKGVQFTTTLNAISF